MNKKIFYLTLMLISFGLFTACSDDDDPKSNEALITAMTFEDPAVVIQPVIDGTDITFSVAYSTTDETLSELVPTVTLSRGATVSPKSGSKVDFSDGPVTFTVTAEDGITTKVYTVTCKREANPDALILSMTFDDPVVVVQPIIEGTDITFFVDFYATDEQLAGLIPTIEVSPQATVDPASGSTVDFSEGDVIFTVTAGNGGTSEYTVICKKAASPEAEITAFSIAGDGVLVDAVMEGTEIYFYVHPDAMDGLVPTIEISENATVSPASGSKVDFSSGSVVFTVTSEDGETETEYTVTARKAIVEKYDFEEWTVVNPSASQEFQYSTPGVDWSSSNSGVSYLMTLSMADRFIINKTTESYSGSGAAKIETIDTKGSSFLGRPITPKITTGSLFLGSFETNLSSTLKSTKFGISYDRKPLIVKGYYKYLPGEVFHRSTEASFHKTTTDSFTMDSCTINAILYEIESDDDEYITGKDTYDDDRIVAKAILEDGSAKANYTPFEITMEYTKEYDSSKKYRFAIIMSSSKEGATFSGAPGSALYVDDVEVISIKQ